MKSFKHFETATVEAGSALLASYQGRARALAGGTDLLGILKDRILPDYPEVVLNLKTIPDLDGIKEDNGWLTIGSMARLDQMWRPAR